MTNIRTWLADLGLEHHATVFEAAELTVDDLATLTDADLRDELQLPLGARRRILNALHDDSPAKDQPQAGPDYPADLDPEQLPTYLAHLWANYCQGGHPREQLYWLVDTLEAAVRFAAGLALAEVTAGTAGALPAPMAERLRNLIYGPTLGAWLQVLRTLSDRRWRPEGTPAFIPAVFELTSVFDRHCAADADEAASLLAMRNALAHGGGFSRARAEHYRACHEGRVVEILQAVASALAQHELIGQRGTDYVRLRGTTPTTCEPLAVTLPGEGPWVISDDQALSLSPLLVFGPVRRRESDGTLRVLPHDAVAQLYSRAEQWSLRYTPVGVDEVHSEDETLTARFRTLFHLDEPPADVVASEGRVDGYHWGMFLREARLLAGARIGRAEELATLKQWLKGRRGQAADEPRIGWLSGPPGVGKSQLMANVAADLDNGNVLRDQKGDTSLYYHRFRTGDARNSTLMFLRLLRQALDDWPAIAARAPDADPGADEGEPLVQDVLTRLEVIASLDPDRANAPPPRLVVIIDGLDEVVRHEPTAVNLLRRLALPGTVWLVAGRPDVHLDAAFTPPLAEAIYPAGLPGMSDADIRALLVEHLGPLRYDLLARDEDEGDSEDQPDNPFVAAVVERARGLPLYVHLLIEDLKHKTRSVHDEDRLPASLEAYYEALLQALSVGDIQRALPLLVAALAVAEEPLDERTLKTLVAADDGRVVPDADDSRLAHQVLAAARSLLRQAPTPEGEQGYTLYHTSFRDYVLREGSELARSIRAALRQSEALAQRWDQLEAGALRNHLFRAGTHYALGWSTFKDSAEQAAHLDQTNDRLTDYGYLHARVAALGTHGITDLVSDYATVYKTLPTNDERRSHFRLWEAFVRERAHVLRRGDGDWPAYKILLQLAVEHADDSPVTQGAEAWLAAGHCDWVWLRNPRRQAKAEVDNCLCVLEGHTARVTGAMGLSGGRIISWGHDPGLRLWDSETGAPLAVLACTPDEPRFIVLNDGRILSNVGDDTLQLWDGRTGTPLAVLEGHKRTVQGFQQLADGRILSWSDDATLRLWDGETGAPLAVLQGHERGVQSFQQLADGRILSWDPATLRLWDGETGAPLTAIHSKSITGARVLNDGRILSWSYPYGPIRLWDSETGAPSAVLADHSRRMDGVRVLNNRRILSWAGRPGKYGVWPSDAALQIWDSETAESLAVLIGHCTAPPIILDDGRLLSQTEDGTLHIWDVESVTVLTTLKGHTGQLIGSRLAHGRILSWSWDLSLRLWDGDTGAQLWSVSASDHRGAIYDATVLEDGSIVSWADQNLYLRDGKTGRLKAVLEGHTMRVAGVRQLSDGRLLSWAEEELRLWTNHVEMRVKPEATKSQSQPKGSMVLDDKRLVSWHFDGTLRFWDGETGAALGVLEGHRRWVNGAIVLDNGRILSWSGDATLRIWDGDTGEPLAELTGHSKGRDTVLGVWGATVLDNGRILSWADDATLRIWDGNTGVPWAVLEGHSDNIIEGARQLSDGRILSWSADTTLRFWDRDTGTPLTILEGHSEGVSDAKILADGRILSWASCTLRLWDGETGAALSVLEGHRRPVNGAIVLDNGRILSWSDDATLRIWDGDTGAPRAVLEGHTDRVVGARQLSDGRILSWSDDASLRVWDSEAGALRAVLEGHTAPIVGVRQLRDGRLLSWSSERSWSSDGTLRLWIVPGQMNHRTPLTYKCIDLLCWQPLTRAYIQTADCEQGIITIAVEDGHCFRAWLQHGNQRISMADWLATI